MRPFLAGGLVVGMSLWAALAQGQEASRPVPRSPYHPVGVGDMQPTTPAARPTGFGREVGAPSGEACCPIPALEPCGPPGKCWVRAEYLLWWIKDSPLPPLLTRGTPQGLGLLGAPGTVVVIGGQPVDQGDFSGARFTAGCWLNCEQTCGFEGSFFFLGRQSTCFDAASDGDPILVRPFFNTVTGGQDAEQVANPLIADLPDLLPTAGAVNVRTSSRLWGLEANAIKNLCCGCNYRLDMLGGFRYLRLDERVTIAERVVITDEAPDPDLAGIGFLLTDDFQTRNQFYGGQLGARLEVRRDRLFAQVLGKVALGATHQVVAINGSTVITEPGFAPERFRGGLLALPSNIGTFSRDRFAVVPEVGVNVGYQITPGLRGYVGYTYLYWSDVVRPGDQISLRIDPRQLPPNPAIPGAQPRQRFNDSDFFAHGLNFGLELRY